MQPTSSPRIIVPPATDRRLALSFTIDRTVRLLLFMFLVIVFSLLICTSQTVVVAAFTPPTNLKVGWSGSTSKLKLNGLVNQDSIRWGHPSLMGYWIAIDEINNSTEWLPETHLEGLWLGHHSDQSDQIMNAFELAQTGIVAMIGDQRDDVVTQDVLKRYQIPQIASNSVIPDYSLSRYLYPYFMRNSYSAAILVRSMSNAAVALGYKRIIHMYSTDAFYTTCEVAATMEAKRAGLEIVATLSFPLYSPDFTTIIDNVIKSRCRVIFWIGSLTDMQNIWLQAVREGGDRNIAGAGYIWIIHYAYTTSYTTHDIFTGALIPDLQTANAGQIGMLLPDDPNSPQAKHFSNLFYQRPYNNETFTLHPEVPGSPMYNAAFTYDAVWQVARGLHAMIYDQGLDPRDLNNRALLYDTIRNVTFDGASGHIKLDAVGDRDTNFNIANYKRASQSWEKVGYLSPAGQIVMDPHASFEWPGASLEDSQTQPPDTPLNQLVTITSTVRTSLVVSACIIIGMCICVQIFILLYRNHRVLKASSPVFLFTYVIGIQLLCSSVIPRSYESMINSSPAGAPCDADLFLGNLGYTLMIGSLLVKTVRLELIFNAKKLNINTQLSDSRLIFALLALCLLELALLLGLRFGRPMTIQLYSLREYTDYYICRTDNLYTNELNTIYLPVIMVTRFLLLIIATTYVIKIRNLPDNFNESKQLGMTMYNLLFLSVLLPAIDGALGRGQDAPLIAYSICVFIICCVSIGIMFIPKLHTMFRNPLVDGKAGAGNGAEKQTHLQTVITDSSTGVPNATHTPPVARLPTTAGGRISATGRQIVNTRRPSASVSSSQQPGKMSLASSPIGTNGLIQPGPHTLKAHGSGSGSSTSSLVGNHNEANPNEGVNDHDPSLHPSGTVSIHLDSIQLSPMSPAIEPSPDIAPEGHHLRHTYSHPSQQRSN